MNNLDVDYLTLSAHKIYGPKGVGALYIRDKTLAFKRTGTPNTPGIVGFGVAAQLAKSNLPKYVQIEKLRNKLRDELLKLIPRAHVNGSQESIVPNTLNMSFPGAEGESSLLALDASGICVSTGSACASDRIEPSHVLTAMYAPTSLGPLRSSLHPHLAPEAAAEIAHDSIRFSLGLETTEAEIDYVLGTLPPIIERLRKISGMC